MAAGQGAVEPEKRVIQSDSTARAKHPHAAQQKQKSPTNKLVIVEQPGSPKAKTPESQSDENVEIQRKLVKFTGYLIWVGLIQAAVLAFTIWAIKHQSDTSKNIERAWMIPDLPAYDTQVVGRVICNVRNKGKSPAWIKELKARSITVEPQNGLPDKPDYGEFLEYPGEGSPLTPDIVHIPQFFGMNPDELRNVEQGGKVLYVYGFVKYRDIFRKNRITRYCFRFNPGLAGNPPMMRGFYHDGPAAYNKMT